MARINIPFIVDKQTIKQFPKTKIFAGGKNYFYAVFNDASGIWNDIDNTKASFMHNDLSKPIIVDLIKGDNGMECRIPWEVMTKSGYVDVGVFGGDILPTGMARVFIDAGCISDGNEPQPPTPDWYIIIEQKLNTMPQITEEYYNKLLYCDENGQILPLQLSDSFKIVNGVLMIVGSIPNNPIEPDEPTESSTIAVLGIAMLGEIQLGSK